MLSSVSGFRSSLKSDNAQLRRDDDASVPVNDRNYRNAKTSATRMEYCPFTMSFLDILALLKELVFDGFQARYTFDVNKASTKTCTYSSTTPLPVYLSPAVRVARGLRLRSACKFWW